ncbi:CC0125/CC1285 family lipoprotein [Alteromonas gracilis]|uniref:CC0125/CC1285 family lipoprotein n=1 Tax=Alteromonas gracilis TaxID=1479524 RepID=UPI003736076F
MDNKKIIKKSRLMFAGISAALSLALAGCSSTPVAAPTPYKSASTKASYGYSSEKVSNSEYRVLFKATDKTPADRVQQYALHRAAEIAQQQGFTHLAVIKTNIDKKPVMAREIMTNNEEPVAFNIDRQCTMSGCDEVAQPMAVASSNDVVKTQINDIYFSINVKMANDMTSLGKNAFTVQEVLTKPLEPKNGS